MMVVLKDKLVSREELGLENVLVDIVDHCVPHVVKVIINMTFLMLNAKSVLISLIMLTMTR
jgi:deoxyribose-phosphate aldolase